MLFKKELVVITLLLLTACNDANHQSTVQIEDKQKKIARFTLPVLEVYKHPSCGCCEGWIEHLEQTGFSPVAHNVEDLTFLKKEKSIQPRYQSCHIKTYD